MKKVNQLSREELKKVHGGGPPFTSWWITCFDSDGREQGLIQVSDCTYANDNWGELCRSHGVFAPTGHVCFGGY